MRELIDEHRDTFGVEPICKVVQISPSGYRRHAALQREPHRRCAQAKSDDVLAPEIERVWQANMQVYGAEKVWRQLAREGTAAARCTVERLMKRLGLRGVMRGNVVRTTIGDRKVPCPLDKVNRQFKAERPNQLWVSDFTYVSTWQGWQYVAFVIDVLARRIVGWRVTALRLQQLFGSEAGGWMKLQSTYDLRVAEKTVDKQIVKDVAPMPLTA